MRHAVSELVHHRAHAGDAGFALREVFFHLPEGRIPYVALDIGGWLDATEVLVTADKLTAPAAGARAWQLSLTREEVEAAPRWDTGSAEHMAHLEAWPPLVVGPFGSTYSPILMYEQLLGRGAAGADAPEGDAEVTALERATRWIGRPVACTDGVAGKLDDLLFDDRAMQVTHLVVGQGSFLRHEGHAVPVSALAGADHDPATITLRLATKDVSVAPAPDALPA